MNEWKNIHCMRYRADTPRLRSTTQNICFLISISTVILKLVHQTIPAAPSPPPPPGYCRAFARLVSPGGGAFANLALPWGRAFANPGANPELLTCTRFPITIKLHRGFYWKNKQIGSFVKDGKKLKRFVKACSRFYACTSSWLIKPELHSETRKLLTWSNVFLVIESSFSCY